jgi:tetratricopeptide (TPR) repeat protein
VGKRKNRLPKISTPPPTASAKRSESVVLKYLLIMLGLGALALLAYSNSFHAGFVRDNRFLILDNSRVHEATEENLKLIVQHTYWWPQFETALYRPFTTLSYLFNYAILENGDSPEGYHWVNLFFHFINVLLVFALTLRVLQKLWPAVFVAALWAVHPILTESVTNIIGRSDIFAATAILSGLLMYLKSAESRGWQRYAWLAGLAAVTTIGVFSKESAVAILGVVVLYEVTWWEPGKSVRRLIGGCAAISVPMLTMIWARFAVLASSRPEPAAFLENPLQGAHFFAARLTAISVMGRYMWLLLWPAKLSSDYSYSQIPVASGNFRDWIAWIAVAVAVVAVASQYRKNRPFFFFGAFAFLAFVPVANLLFLTGTIMAERFMYLSAVGFAACAVIAVYAACARIRSGTLAPIILCVIIAGFAVRTWVRNLDWRDEVSIATASVRASPNSYKTHLALALALTGADPSRSNIDQVIGEMEKSMAIVDSVPDTLNSSLVYAKAGSDYTAKGDLLVRKNPEGRPVISEASIQEYKRSLQILTRGVAIDEASGAVYREKLRASGKYETIPVGLAQLYSQLAVTQMRLGNNQKAYEAAVHAQQLDPSRAETDAVLGQSLALLGRGDEAAVALIEGSLVSGQRNLFGMLDVLYRSGVDREGCAMIRGANGITLNKECAVVHQETCQAWAELIQLYKQGEWNELADHARSRAIDNFGCSADMQK